MKIALEREVNVEESSARVFRVFSDEDTSWEREYVLEADGDFICTLHDRPIHANADCDHKRAVVRFLNHRVIEG